MQIEMAAEVLTKHLGDTLDNWLKKIKQDSRRAEGNRDFPFIVAIPAHGDGEPFKVYRSSDIYKFISRRNPSSLGFQPYKHGCAKGTTYQVKARLHCDLANGGSPSIRLDEEIPFFGDRRLSIEGARHLAQEILRLVDYCASHEFSLEEWDFVPREKASNQRLIELLIKKRDQLRCLSEEEAEYEC